MKKHTSSISSILGWKCLDSNILTVNTTKIDSFGFYFRYSKFSVESNEFPVKYAIRCAFDLGYAAFINSLFDYIYFIFGYWIATH